MRGDHLLEKNGLLERHVELRNWKVIHDQADANRKKREEELEASKAVQHKDRLRRRREDLASKLAEVDKELEEL